jgi:ribosome-binding protein aMBF1 (putative translation factor)
MDKQNRYKPVKHTKATTARLLAADPELKKAYDALEDEFAALDALLSARLKAGLSQAEVARRMKIKASSLARIEASLASREHSPSFAMLQRYAAACGRKLVIKFA